MKVLITGGAGYIGTSLVAYLARLNSIDEIIIYDNLSRGNRSFFTSDNKYNTPIRFEQGELLDSRKLLKCLDGVDVVFHLAANVTTPFSNQNSHLFEQVNHWGTAELTYAIEQTNVSKLIHLSSVSVYGNSSKLKEVGDDLNPQTFYGISKMRAEDHIKRLSNNLETYIIRCGNVYGYNRSIRYDAVINAFMFEANYKNRITINGTGEQKRAFIHIDKACEALSKLATEKFSSGTFNLVERNMAIGEVVQELREIYPNLEMLFINQHMKMKELQVLGSAELNKLYSSNKSLTEELKDFKSAFLY